ncbi:hypothetical protein QJQ45_027424, partial [Haematococcus lacustris]
MARHRGRGRGRGGFRVPDAAAPFPPVECQLHVADLPTLRLALAQGQLQAWLHGWDQEYPGPACTLTCRMGPGHVSQLLDWLCTAVAADPGCFLEFPTSTGKTQRAALHRLVDANYASQLQTYSHGWGAQRCLRVYARGAAPAKAAGERERELALRLFRYVCQEGRGATTSVDELAERWAADDLSEELQELWRRKEAQQAVLQRFIAALEANDVAAVQDLCEANPEAVRGGWRDVDTGGSLLHVAARLGAAACMRVLLAGGSPLEATDMQHKTPLKVSRTFETTECEALLLQAGARDPDAHLVPLNATTRSLGQLRPQLSGATTTPQEHSSSQPGPGPERVEPTPHQKEEGGEEEEEGEEGQLRPELAGSTGSAGRAARACMMGQDGADQAPCSQAGSPAPPCSALVGPGGGAECSGLGLSGSRTWGAGSG